MDHLETFKQKLGHGSFRNIRGGIEVRVRDLDRSKAEANRVIKNHNLDLEVTNIDIRLRSFDVVHKSK